MDIKPSLIDLDSIDHSFDVSSFDADKILYLANSIANLKGLLRIPVVKQINIDSYKLVSGVFEYLAYFKALEINPELPDRIRVFIAESNNEAVIQEQIKVFENLEKTSESVNLEQSSDLSILMSNLSTRLNNLEEEIKSNHKQTKIELLEAIDTKIPSPLPPLQAFNQILNPQVAEIVTKKLAFLRNSKKIIQRLIAIKKENPEQEFKKFDEVITALGKGYISRDKMLEVIDNWN